MKNENNKSLLFSMLLSRNKYGEHEVTVEDLKYLHIPGVCECQVKMYLLVIDCLSQGMSYEEIYEFIDKITFDEYRMLDPEARTYVKKKIRKDVDTRRKNELKNEGEIK